MNKDNNLPKQLTDIHKDIIHLVNNELEHLYLALDKTERASRISNIFGIRMMMTQTLKAIEDNPSIKVFIDQFGQVAEETLEETRREHNGN